MVAIKINIEITFKKLCSNKDEAESLNFGSCWSKRERNSCPSSLRFGGVAGTSPIPTLNIIA